MTVQVQQNQIIFNDGTAQYSFGQYYYDIDTYEHNPGTSGFPVSGSTPGVAKAPLAYLATNYAGLHFHPGPFARRTPFYSGYLTDVGLESVAAQDWAVPYTGGSYHIQPVLGGANLTDTPYQFTYDKANGYSVYPSAAWTVQNDANIAMPAAPFDSNIDSRGWYKKYYFRYDAPENSSAGTPVQYWSQREQIWRGETVGTGSRDAILQTEAYYGTFASVNSFWYNEMSNVQTVNTNGTFLSAGPTSLSLVVGDVVTLRVNGRLGRISYSVYDTIGLGTNTAATIACSGYTAQGLQFTATGTCTLYYQYWAIGEDADHTFAKVFKRNTATATLYSNWTSNDATSRIWNYNFRNDQIPADGGAAFPYTMGDSGISAKNRVWTASPLTLPNGSRPYSINWNFTVNDITVLNQGVFYANSGLQATVACGIHGMINKQGVDRRLAITLSDAAAGLIVTWLRCWQYTANGETTDVTWSWNPAETSFPGRLYVNGLMVFKTATNPFGAGASCIGAGCFANNNTAAANNTYFNSGFVGTINRISVVPEALGYYVPQGAIGTDIPANGLTTTVNNGIGTYGISTRGPTPIQSYVLSSPAFPYGTYYNKATVPYLFDTTTSNTQTCVLTSGNQNVPFTYASGGVWPHQPGYFIVTGTGIPTTNTVYTILNTGDTSFNLYDGGAFSFGAAVTATATSTLVSPTTVTFVRVNGGFNTIQATETLNFTTNANTITKQTNLSVTYTNALCANAENAQQTTAAFPNVTFTVSAGSAGNYGVAGVYYMQTQNSTGNDAAVRHLQNALGIGKHYSLTGSGITVTSATVDNTYITAAEWDFYGRGLHRITTSIALTGTQTVGATITSNYCPGAFDTFYANLDYTGTTNAVADGVNYGYSTLTPNGVSGAYSGSQVELAYGLGQFRYYRITPPHAVYDSGIFKATSASFTKKMYLGYGAVGYLITYGTSADYNTSTSTPTTTLLSTVGQIYASGITVAVTSGTYYRIVVYPLTSSNVSR